MSQKEGKGVNARRIFLTAKQQIGLYGLCAKYGIAEKSAILLAISKGLEAFEFLSKEQFEQDFKRYSEPLIKKVERKKEEREALEKAKEKAEEKLPEPEITVSSIEDFKEKYKDVLEVTETDKTFIAKPKSGTYLGQENFIKVSNDVRTLKGRYISKGKDSHFKIPKNRK